MELLSQKIVLVKDVPSSLGQAAKCLGTVIVEGAGNPETIANHCHQVSKIRNNNFRIRKLQEQRLVSGGVAVIKVGAATETELKE